MERASIHQLYPEPDKSLAELETRSDVNFYLDSDAENEVYSGLLVEAIFEIV